MKLNQMRHWERVSHWCVHIGMKSHDNTKNNLRKKQKNSIVAKSPKRKRNNLIVLLSFCSAIGCCQNDIIGDTTQVLQLSSGIALLGTAELVGGAQWMTLGDASDFFLRKNDNLYHGKATPFKSFQLIQVVSTNKCHKNSDSLDEQLSGSHTTAFLMCSWRTSGWWTVCLSASVASQEFYGILHQDFCSFATHGCITTSHDSS